MQASVSLWSLSDPRLIRCGECNRIHTCRIQSQSGWVCDGCGSDFIQGLGLDPQLSTVIKPVQEVKPKRKPAPKNYSFVVQPKRADGEPPAPKPKPRRTKTQAKPKSTRPPGREWNPNLERIPCPTCGSERVYKSGKSFQQKQRWECGDCRYKFIDSEQKFYAGIPEEDQNKILQLRAAGLSIRTISEQTNLGWSRVRRFLAKDNAKTGKGRKSSADYRDKVLELYRQGCCNTEICKALELTHANGVYFVAGIIGSRIRLFTGGSKLRELRGKRSQAQIAVSVGFGSGSVVKRLERLKTIRPHSNGSLQNLRKLCEFYGLNLEDWIRVEPQ